MIKFKHWMYMNFGIVLIACATYFFLMPNLFVTGGMSGLATILGKLAPIMTKSTWLMLLNIIMLVVGFIFLGKKTGIWTVYCSLGYSSLMRVFEVIFPLENGATLTDETFMELCLGILIYAVGTAIIFYAGASSGGMDIVALMVQKYAKIDVGKAVLCANTLIAVGAVFAFSNLENNVERSLLSLVGLFANSFIIDSVIDNFHSCKYFVVITDKTELVSEYIMNHLGHGVTIVDAIGAYTQSEKGMIHTVCRRYEAIKLRQAIKKIDENAFIVVTTSSEIIGKGFRNV
ncbi:MAG: YitT family protein [Clostridia bacterium]|nr:YitT family protein [Clostridia bacterium]